MADRPLRKAFVRPILRALHRDFGYLAVGLTLTYALSGIAVNHLADWDPNFHNYEHQVELGENLSGLGAASPPGTGPEGDAARTSAILAKLGIGEAPKETYRAGDDQLEILFEHRTVHVNTTTGHVVDEGQRPRFLLRAANWLHLNRGKKAWTYVADSYGAALLFLAISGMFMLPGRRGLAGRGAVFVGIGVAIPVLYVVFSGGG